MPPITPYTMRIKALLARWQQQNIPVQYEGVRVDCEDGTIHDGVVFQDGQRRLPDDMTADLAGWIPIDDAY